MSVATPIHATSTSNAKGPGGDVFATLINLAGRRRFTSQRLVLFTILAAEGRPSAITSAREALDLFRAAHVSLVDGVDGQAPHMSPALKDIYFGSEAGDRRIREFMDLAERTFTAIESRWRLAQPMVDELVASTTPLLALLNALTTLYESDARSHAERVRTQMRTVMSEIKDISKQAHMVAFNAQIVAARSGNSGREFSAVANVISQLTSELDKLVRQAISFEGQ